MTFDRDLPEPMLVWAGFSVRAVPEPMSFHRMES